MRTHEVSVFLLVEKIMSSYVSNVKRTMAYAAKNNYRHNSNIKYLYCKVLKKEISVDKSEDVQYN